MSIKFLSTVNGYTYGWYIYRYIHNQYCGYFYLYSVSNSSCISVFINNRVSARSQVSAHIFVTELQTCMIYFYIHIKDRIIAILIKLKQ